MRKLTYTLGAMVLAAAMAAPAHAALITIGVRAIAVNGGAGTALNSGTSATVANIGDTVTLQLYADVTDTDGNAQNDGFLSSLISVLNSDSVGNAEIGNLGNASPNFIAYGSQISTSLSSQPASTSVGGQIELGTSAQTSNTPFAGVSGASAPNETFSTGPTSGAPSVTEFVIGTTTWTATAVGTSSDFDNVQIGLRIASGAAGHVYKFESDGTTYALGGTDANLVLGTAVSITGPAAVPEPATVGLLGVALAGMALRRNRKNKVVA